MQYKMAIFDLDGTLVDSLADLADATNYALKKFGQPCWQVQEYRQKVGNSTNMLISRALAADKQYLFNDVLREMSKKYSQICLNKTRAYAGVPETLRELRNRNVKLAVLTNKNQDMAERITMHFFGRDIFDAIVGSRTGNPIKPQPDQTLELIGRFNIKPQEVIFVGDSDVDMQTAKNCGILAVGVSWGFRTVQELKDNGADIIIDKPGEIINLFD